MVTPSFQLIYGWGKNKLAMAPKYTAVWNVCGNSNIVHGIFLNLREATDPWERIYNYSHLID